MNDPVQAFLAEAGELNESIYTAAKALQQALASGDPLIHSVNDLFRAFHTLKGLAGMNGFSAISRFAHEVEDLLDELRKGTRTPDEDLVRVLVLSTELVDLFLDAVRTIGKDTIEEDRLNRFRQRIQSLKPAAATSVTLPDEFPADIAGQLNDQEAARLGISIRNGLSIYLSDVAFSFETFDQRLRDIQDAINQSGETIATLPGEDTTTDTSISFKLLFASSLDLEALRAFHPESAVIRVLLTGSPSETAPETPAMPPSQTSGPPGDGGQWVRVPLSSLDQLMQDLEELLLVQARALAELGRMQPDQTTEAGDRLRFLLKLVSEQVRRLQKRVVTYRMVPLGSIFRQLESAVLRTAEATGKTVHLELSGEGTRIDKQLTDQLVEPLIHLLRNAVDHGIESLQERKKAGKPETGTIRLFATQQGNAVVLDISDDGSGLDFDRIRDRAVERGLATKGRKYKPSELVDFLFEPGFSTARKISDISGRGVGLDVVKTEINRLGGSIQVTTEPGRGTTVRLQLPITRAILPVCFIQSGEIALALPLLFVVDIQPFEPDRASYVRERLFYRMHDHSLPAIHLPMLLKTADLTTEPAIVIVMHHFGTRFCVLAEDVLDEREVTVTPFRGKLGQMPLFSGVCTYSDRSLGYVLDVPRLIAAAGGSDDRT